MLAMWKTQAAKTRARICLIEIDAQTHSYLKCKKIPLRQSTAKKLSLEKIINEKKNRGFSL